MRRDNWAITREMTITETLDRHPHLERVFTHLGMACCSCYGAGLDTIEHVSWVYGLDPEIVVCTLNAAVLFPSSPDPPK